LSTLKFSPWFHHSLKKEKKKEKAEAALYIHLILKTFKKKVSFLYSITEFK